MNSESYLITIQSGPHTRQHCPVSFTVPEELRGASWELRQPDGSTLPIQTFPNGMGAFLLPYLEANATLKLILQPACDPQPSAAPQVTITDNSRALAIEVGGTPLTTYYYADVPARPYFYPLLTAAGQEVTRAFPMRTDVAGESRDHPHHRSLWIAFGDVNGSDNWSEESGHGSTRHETVSHSTSGAVCGKFETTGSWLTSEGEKLLTQRLQVVAWATPPEFRILDFTIDLTAEQKAVEFGDTKEGGILAVRVVGTMDVPRGGRIENSYGGIDEGETWGKAAHWCDYSGPVEAGNAGIAVMDHPLSFRYPTHWHVRNYGLMTANPFGYAAYTGGAKRGEHRLAPGETLHFQYRVILHSGDADEGQIRGRYLDFVSPPRATVTRQE
ncbi:MAG: hypothetical protein JWN14_3122 [Chthonomonadales bacterium]|nr:hypothetical protein [Chthonomonadales bacterium]